MEISVSDYVIKTAILAIFKQLQYVLHSMDSKTKRRRKGARSKFERRKNWERQGSYHSSNTSSMPTSTISPLLCVRTSSSPQPASPDGALFSSLPVSIPRCGPLQFVTTSLQHQTLYSLTSTTETSQYPQGSPDCGFSTSLLVSIPLCCLPGSSSSLQVSIPLRCLPASPSSLQISIPLSCLPQMGSLSQALPAESKSSSSLPVSLPLCGLQQFTSHLTVSIPLCDLPLRSSLSQLGLSLPDKQWQIIEHDGEVQYCKVVKADNGACRVTSTLNIYSDKSWDVFIFDRKVPRENSLLSGFPDYISSSSKATELLDTIHGAFMCPGNPDEKFVNMCSKRGGEVRGDRGHGDVVAYVDSTSVTDSDGKSFCCSVRRTDCQLLCSLPGRCKSCSGFRSSLRKTLSRQQKESTHDCTLSSSHTSYSNLSAKEKDARMRNLHHSYKLASQQVTALKEKLKRQIEVQSLTLHEEDASDMDAVIKEVTPIVKENFPPCTPQRIFWEQQVVMPVM